MLEKNEARRYAQAHRRIELGVWGYPHSLFRAIHSRRSHKCARIIETIECGIKQ